MWQNKCYQRNMFLMLYITQHHIYSCKAYQVMINITCIIITIIIIIFLFFCIFYVFQRLRKIVAPDSLEKTVVQNVLIHILGKTVRNDVIVTKACVTFLPDVLLSQQVSNQFRFFYLNLLFFT